MRTTRGTLLAALALLAACRDVPTTPDMDLKAETTEAASAAALDQAAASVLAAIDAPLAQATRDTTRTPPDSTRTRPDSLRTRPARPDQPEPRRPAARAQLAVELGAQAIELAERLLKGGADEEQKRFLEKAKDLEARARAALDAGNEAAAGELAENASQTALKAVVLPGGVTEHEAHMIHDVAQDLLRDARAAVERDPTEMKRLLLSIAEQLFRDGTDQLRDTRGFERAVATLWKSAVISSWLIG